MRIEKLRIEIIPIDMDHVRKRHALPGLITNKNFALNPAQFEYLQMLRAGTPIAVLISHYREQGVPVQYKALYDLIAFLSREGYVINPSVGAYFARRWPTSRGLLGGLVAKVLGPGADVVRVREEVMTLPFFRVLDANLVKQFLDHAKVIEAPADIFVCQAGQKQRSLFVLLRGSVSVYRHDPEGSRTRLAVLGKHSVFGEVGFFIGAPRTADVVTDEDSVLLSIPHASAYDKLFTSDEGSEVQKRFWLIQALQKSSAFRHLPEDCFDELATAGTIRKYPARHTLCKQGDDGDSVYVLAQGEVRVSKDGKEIGTLRPGDCFGELALLKSSGKRTATVATTNECTALEISTEAFFKLLSENLALACEFENVAEQRIE